MKPMTTAIISRNDRTTRRLTAVRQTVGLLQASLVDYCPYLIWFAFFLPGEGRAATATIVPKPVSFAEGSGAFQLAPYTAIDADGASQKTARRLKQTFSPATGFNFAPPSGGNTIVI